MVGIATSLIMLAFAMMAAIRITPTPRRPQKTNRRKTTSKTAKPHRLDPLDGPRNPPNRGPSLRNDGSNPLTSSHGPSGDAPINPSLEKVTSNGTRNCNASGAEALVIVTEWDAFRALDLDRIKMLMASPSMVDLLNVYRPEK